MNDPPEEGPEDLCPRCQGMVSPAAEVCPFCRSRLTLDVFVLSPVADGRARYQVAREVVALGGPALELGQVQQALQRPNGVVARGATRLMTARVLETLARHGVEASYEPAKAGAIAVGRIIGRAASGRRGHRGLIVAVASAVVITVAVSLLWLGWEPSDMTPAEIGRRAMPALALLKCKDSLGSGFFVTRELLITNAHVVCPEIQVQFGGRSLPGQVVKQDDGLDMALLKVSGANARTIPLGDATTLHVGDGVVLLGSPQGLGETLQRGTVSHLGRAIMGNAYVQVDANVNPGNSGGPLIDRKGRVVGVITMAYTGAKGIGFALPINYATRGSAFVKGPSQRDWRGLARPGVLTFQEWTSKAETEDEKDADQIRNSIDRPTLVSAVPGPQGVILAVLVQRSGWTPGAVVRPFRVNRAGMRICEGKVRVARWIHPEADGGPEPVYIRWLRKHGLDQGLYIGVGPADGGRACAFEAVVGGEMVMEGEDGVADRVSIVPPSES